MQITPTTQTPPPSTADAENMRTATAAQTPATINRRINAMDMTTTATDAPTPTEISSPAHRTDSAPDSIQPPQAPPTAQKRRRKDNTSAAAHNRYMGKTYDRLNLQIIKGDKARLQATAAALDMSPTALIIAAVNAYVGDAILTPKGINPYI